MSTNICKCGCLWEQTIQNFTHTWVATNLCDLTILNIRPKSHPRLKHRQWSDLPTNNVADADCGIISDPWEIQKLIILNQLCQRSNAEMNVIWHFASQGLLLSGCNYSAYSFKAAHYLREHLRLNDNLDICQIYFPNGHHLLNTGLGNIRIYGSCIQSSTVITRSAWQFLPRYMYHNIDNPMDPPPPPTSAEGYLCAILAYIQLLLLCAVCNIVLCRTVLSRALVISCNTVTAAVYWSRDKMANILQTPY